MRRRSERGAVTAELALGLPLLTALTVGLVWLLAVGVAQIRTVDAARETARALARGDSEADAVAAGRAVAPDGATLSVGREGARVVVRVRGRLPGPGGVFATLPGARLRADAVTEAEGR